MIERRTIPLPLLRPPRRIAIFRALQLGDLLVAVPALRSIRAGFPDAEISLIGLPWAASFVQRFHHLLDRFVEFPGYPGLIEVPCDPERTHRFLTAQHGYYDLAIQMHGSGETSNQFVRALGARVTAGSHADEPAGLDLALLYPFDQPEVLRNLGLAQLLGCPDRGTDLEFPLTDGDRREAFSLLARLRWAGRPWIGLHPGARSPARRWPADYFATTGNELARRCNAQIVVTGGPGEEAVAQTVLNSLEEPVLNLAGKTSLGGLAAVIDRLDLFISNDTGPAHLADALGTPSVTIFGPADPVRWAPLDGERHPIVRRPVACSPCTFWECPIDHRCLRRLRPDQVIQVAERLLFTGAVACNA